MPNYHMPHNKTKSWQHCLSPGNCGNIPGSLQPYSNLRFNALLIPAHHLSIAGWDWLRGRSCWPLGCVGMVRAWSLQREVWVAFTTQVRTVYEDCKCQHSVSCLVCCGVTGSWLIFHQKFAVSGLGQSSPCGCPPFEMHSFTELPRVQSH